MFFCQGYCIASPCKEHIINLFRVYDFFPFFFSFELQNEEETKKEESLKSPLKLESQLDLRVQELIKLICNVQAMEEMMVEMKYDTKKAPLGRASDSILHAHFIFLVHLTGYFITIMI